MAQSLLTPLPLSTPPIPAGGDTAYRDDFSPALVNGIKAAQDEHITKTVSQDYADKELGRPVLKDYSERLFAHGNVTGAVVVNMTSGNHQTMTLTGAVTLSITNPPPVSARGFLFLSIKQDATGGRVVTFPAAFKDNSGAQFAINGTSANKITDVIAYSDDGGTTWRAKQGDEWTI
jgi:hypothetical protein